VAHALLRAASVLSRNLYAADSGSCRLNQLKSRPLRFFSQGPDLLFAIQCFVVFGSFIDILLSVFHKSVGQARQFAGHRRDGFGAPSRLRRRRYCAPGWL